MRSQSSSSPELISFLSTPVLVEISTATSSIHIRMSASLSMVSRLITSFNVTSFHFCSNRGSARRTWKKSYFKLCAMPTASTWTPELWIRPNFALNYTSLALVDTMLSPNCRQLPQSTQIHSYSSTLFSHPTCDGHILHQSPIFLQSLTCCFVVAYIYCQ